MLITEIRFLRVKCQPSLSSPKARPILPHKQILGEVLCQRSQGRSVGFGFPRCRWSYSLQWRQRQLTPRPESGRPSRYSPKRQAASQVRFPLAAVFTPTRRFEPEAPVRRACSLMTKATLLLDTRHRFDSTSLCMIQTKGRAARLLRPRAAHSGSPPALKNKGEVKIKTPYGTLGTRG